MAVILWVIFISTEYRRRESAVKRFGVQLNSKVRAEAQP
jgi:hypothetical protein